MREAPHTALTHSPHDEPPARDAWAAAGVHLSAWRVTPQGERRAPHPSPPLYTLTVDRPEAMNALDQGAISALRASAEWLSALPREGLGGVALKGGGGRFIAGGDLKALHTARDTAAVRHFSEAMREALALLGALPCPTLAIIERFAIGGGAEIALAADLCVMEEGSYLRFAQRGLGLSTGWGGARALARVVGEHTAFALLCDDRPIPAEEARALRIAHRLTPPGEATREGLAWLIDLASTHDATAALKDLTRGARAREAAPATRAELDRERDAFEALWVSPLHWERVEGAVAARRAAREAAQGAQGAPPRGSFIVLEGIDGAGTTTQAHRLVAWLESQGRRAHFTCEPSSGVLGALTRRALRGEPLGREGRPLPPEALALMFAADRADHWRNEIAPRLAEGVDVVCDRYVYSSLAYQSQEVPLEWVRALNRPFPAPDVILYLRASAALGAARRAARGGVADRYEVDALQERIARAYDIACAEAGACVIDASLSIDEVFARCASACEAARATRDRTRHQTPDRPRDS
jgi:dTMP kinase